MSVTIDLPKELESELSTEAAKFGLSLSEYALHILSSSFIIGNKPDTGADLVDYWQSQGVIGWRPDIKDSLKHAQWIRNQAEHRRET